MYLIIIRVAGEIIKFVSGGITGHHYLIGSQQRAVTPLSLARGNSSPVDPLKGNKMKTDAKDYDEYIAFLTPYLSVEGEREDAKYAIDALKSYREQGFAFGHAMILLVKDKFGIDGDDLHAIQAALDAGIDVFGDSDGNDFHVKI